jgi:hypothetical protein
VPSAQIYGSTLAASSQTARLSPSNSAHLLQRRRDRPTQVQVRLLEAAQDRWQAVNGSHLVALVRAGARFDKGVMIKRPDEAQEVAA